MTPVFAYKTLAHVPRTVAHVVAGTLLACATALADAPAGRTPDHVVSRFRLGPFFEYSATRDGATFWAVRPFYSKVQDPVIDTRVTDVVWPLSTFHRDREQAWWRFLLAYGSDDDVACDESAWKFALLPLWFQGRRRLGEEYWALFPIHGHLPHLALMDDVDFTLFPFYFNYEVNGVERVYTPWPFYSRLTENPHLREEGVFPLWCRQVNTKRLTDRRYAFWPFWTSAVYGGERNPGTSFLLFPFYGEVNRSNETQRMVLPPFFSYARTDSAERWRMPWPFYQTHETWATATTKPSLKRSYWPFYGNVAGDGDRRWYAAWPLMWHSSSESKNRRAERTRFFPFYAHETVCKTDKTGESYEAERYTRVWPFYAREATPERTRLRVLELNLIRYSGGVERNWAPFWTLYERFGAPDGTARHDLLWGTVQWTTGTTGRDR
ncbi:MAG TPA: hypothetical protein PLR91_09790 [Kiritimatiellia bacterium]|jgi:hypothetical protein|nr:hypothetical protein [Kiritimatiellia bacterium]